ncbi:MULTISPECIES: diacylglycerol kinase family protein [Cryobacterium]|uniref:Diacylglycerol kinase n=1 Tax=Cryobacterium breve TaxID=1259258 RepID=A0ABY2IV32_9MICO|nr:MULTISPECIES: diacylglycerol kinase family protein [Cryobacterium]TFC93592.1 diacylglycerol kinase [Cryobacterium sp. TmT3-12]TFC95354.1 diacylglycerol kinase [Cryobacterium breve]
MTSSDLHDDALHDHALPGEAAAAHRLAAVVYNPVKVNLDELKTTVAAEQAEAGWPETLWFETSAEDPGQGPAREAIEAGASVIIVAGGDGTVRAVAEAVHGTDCALALLPSGTGNLLARNLQLPLDDAAHSIHTAFTGRDKTIDVCLIDIERADRSIDRHTYLVMAGLGLDAKMLANTDDALKAKAGWLAYVKALIAVGKDDSELRFRYRLNNQPEQSLRAHTIMVGNCGSLPASIELIPDAALDDGKFDVVVLKPEGIGGWLQILSKVLWENGVLSRTALGRKLRSGDVDALNYATGTKLILRLSGPEEIELDGDGFGTAVALKTWVDAASLTVRVPSDVA